MEFEIDHEHSAHMRLVRPYMATGGRTNVPELSVETMVVAIKAEPVGIADESARLFAHCDEPAAIAELASDLELPLGITRVLAGDLIASGHIEALATAAPSDASIVRRILNAINV